MLWKSDELNQREILLETSYQAVLETLRNAYLQIAKRIINEIKSLYADIKAHKDVVSISDLYQYDRYYKLLASINSELDKLGFNQTNVIRECLTKYYIDNSKLIGEQISLFTEVSTQQALDVISSVWVNDGLIWSDRIWNNKKQLVDDLMTTLVDIVTTGAEPARVERNLMRHTSEFRGMEDIDFSKLTKQEKINFDKAYKRVKRLVRTELKHIEVMSAINRYQEAGLTHYQYVTAGDDKVCQVYDLDGEPEYCRNLNLQVFPINDTKHLPPQHPNCRCSVLPYFN